MNFFSIIIFFFALGACVQPNEAKQKIQQAAALKFDTTLLKKTSEVLNEDKYWAIIEASLKNTGSHDAQLRFLTEELGKLSPEEIIGFKLRTEKLSRAIYTSEMWCAGYIINGGCSDDGFDYFRYWIISRGKATYYNAKKNPDDLLADAVKEKEYHEFESFSYVAVDAFTQKTGQDLYKYWDAVAFNASLEPFKEIKFNWEENDPQSMRKICPRLFEEFS